MAKTMVRVRATVNLPGWPVGTVGVVNPDDVQEFLRVGYLVIEGDGVPMPDDQKPAARRDSDRE